MKTLKFTNKTTGATLEVDSEKLIGNSTKSLYIRKGFINGTLFLSQKGNGAYGAGDITRLDHQHTVEVNTNLFERITILATKSNAII